MGRKLSSSERVIDVLFKNARKQYTKASKVQFSFLSVLFMIGFAVGTVVVVLVGASSGELNNMRTFSANNQFTDPLVQRCSGVDPKSLAIGAHNGTVDVYATGVTGSGDVRFVAWSLTDGQDDLSWYRAENLGAGTWKATLDLGRHMGTGRIEVEAWMFGPTTSTLCGSVALTRV